MTYENQYNELLKKHKLNILQLPLNLQQLIEKYEKAHKAWASSEEQGKELFYGVLAQTDVVICAKITVFIHSDKNIPTTDTKTETKKVKKKEVKEQVKEEPQMNRNKLEELIQKARLLKSKS